MRQNSKPDVIRAFGEHKGPTFRIGTLDGQPEIRSIGTRHALKHEEDVIGLIAGRQWYDIDIISLFWRLIYSLSRQSLKETRSLE